MYHALTCFNVDNILFTRDILSPYKNTTKISLRPGLRPDPAEELTMLPQGVRRYVGFTPMWERTMCGIRAGRRGCAPSDPLVGWGRAYALPYPTPLSDEAPRFLRLRLSFLGPTKNLPTGPNCLNVVYFVISELG